MLFPLEHGFIFQKQRWTRHKYRPVVGNFLYGRTGYAAGLLDIFVITGSTLIWVIRKLWT